MAITKKIGSMAGALVALLIAVAGLPNLAGAAPDGVYLESTNRSPRGEGGALIWPLYTVTNTNTLLAITHTSITVHGDDALASACSGNNCLGAPNLPGDKGGFSVNSPGQWTLVHFHVRKDTDSSDLKDWKVCLSPGDVWSATFTASGASDTTIDTTDTSDVTGGTVFPVTIAGTKGYVEAVAIDSGTTQVNGCNNISDDNPIAGDVSEANINATHSLMGEAFFVSLGTGLASGYNATALDSFQDYDEDYVIANSVKHTGFPDPPNTDPNTAQKRSFFALAFGPGGNTVGSLQSRWLVDAALGMDTQMVVTFPVGNVTLKPGVDFGFTGTDRCTNCQTFNFNIPSKMALYLRDDEELRSAGSPVQVTMGNEVNVISLASVIAANPGLLPTPTTQAGWLNLLIDDDENEFTDSVQGKTCLNNVGTGDTCLALAGTLNNHFVPAALPVVGFTILQASTGGNLLSALLPWKTASPYSQYGCDAAAGDHGSCSGVGIDIID